MKSKFLKLILIATVIFNYSCNESKSEKEIFISDLMSKMTLDEKVGQMTQVERKELDHISDLATYNIGSLLSGGGSAPIPNTLDAWIKMYNEYQTISMQSSSGIPMIYGIDAVHGRLDPCVCVAGHAHQRFRIGYFFIGWPQLAR